MNRRSIIFLSSAVLLFFAGSSLAASGQSSPVKVSANVDKNSVTIGDKIVYTITVKADKGIEIKFPQVSSQELGGLAIKDFGSSARGWWRRKIYKQWYKLNTYTSGIYTIPKAVIKYRSKDDKQWKEIKSDEVRVDVKSILKNAKDASDIRDIASPVGVGGKTWVYILGSILALLILGGIIFIILKRRKKKQPVIPLQPAHEIAYQALNALREKDYLKQGEVKTYYIELSDIVRKYLENRFNLRAPEMTTEEFLNAAGSNKMLSYEHRKLLSDFLFHCDLVKFAKYMPQQEEAELSFEFAKRLIDQTKETTEIHQEAR